MARGRKRSIAEVHRNTTTSAPPLPEDPVPTNQPLVEVPAAAATTTTEAAETEAEAEAPPPPVNAEEAALKTLTENLVGIPRARY